MNADNLFGISGLTIGGAGIWAIFGSLVIWWIRGMPDRRRARNEGVAVESEVNDALYQRMLAEMARMTARVATLEGRVDVLEQEKRALTGERDAALAENARLRAVNAGQGEVRAQVAAIVAADRLEARATGTHS